MDEAKLNDFLSSHHDAVLSTFRLNGDIQLSIVTVGPLENGAAFTTTEERAKLINLKRNPKCSLLVSTNNWSPYIVLQGEAKIYTFKNTPEHEIASILRKVYKNASGREHSNWEEYDEAMKADKRAAVVVVPEKIYGTA